MYGRIAYIYLKKAFDHRRLLWKLEHIGELKGTLKNWMEDYLKEREMRTVVKDEKSEWRSEKWNTTGISFGTNNVFNICK